MAPHCSSFTRDYDCALPDGHTGWHRNADGSHEWFSRADMKEPHVFAALANPHDCAAIGLRYPWEPIDARSCGDMRQNAYCTRPQGHEGPHVAHATDAHAIAWWPNVSGPDGVR